MFTELQLEPALIQAVKELGYEKPTDIQLRAIPIVKAGKDLVGQSETGSGKTAAFGLPMLEKIESGKGLQSLILVPTRELAEQVAKELKKFSKYKRLHIVTVYGGVSINPQIDNLRHADIVVATPGRCIDHLERRTIDLSRVKILILDEADKMFEMGFIDAVKHIVGHIPKQRQTLMFSATMLPAVMDLARNYMHNPERVKTNMHVDKGKLTQGYYAVESRDKTSLLVHLIKQHAKQAIVFCGTRHSADFVSRNLYKSGISAQAIHGGLSQAKRQHVLDQFRDDKLQILVATDVAARGLDIKNVAYVFNFDIPKSSQDYTHRIGRTARAGASGEAISFLSERDHDNFRNVLSDRSINIPALQTPQFERLKFEPQRREGGFHRGGGGFRHGGQRSGGFHGQRDGQRSGGYGQRSGGYGQRDGQRSDGQRGGFHGQRSGYGNRSDERHGDRPQHKGYKFGQGGSYH